MSFPRHSAYRDSGVQWLGEVPEHWTITRLGFECDTLVPMRDKPERLDGDIPWVRIEDFDGKFISGSRSAQGVSAETVDAMNLKVLPVGTVLCSCSCSMGATAIVAKPLVTNQTFIGIVPKGSFSSDYLYFVFQAASEHLNNIGTGAIQTYLSRDDFRSLRLPRPPLAEQVLLATFLDRETAKTDALMAEQRRLIDLLGEKRRAVISRAVTKGLNPPALRTPSGIEWIGDVPEHWTVSRLSYHAAIENGTTPSRDNVDYWSSGDVPWLSSGEVNQYRITEVSESITTKALAECSLRLLPKGTVVVGMIGQGKTRGMAASLEIEATINQNLAAVVPHEWLKTDYLLYLFQAAYEYLRELGRGGNQAALNCEILSALKIPLPPVNEQVSICEFLGQQTGSFDLLIAESGRAIDLLQERRAALISAVVTGKVDVRELVQTEAA